MDQIENHKNWLAVLIVLTLGLALIALIVRKVRE